ncbi:MAG: type II toxin-antitoxin system RelE/ParE family toxin [Planctomycetota bacterium]
MKKPLVLDAEARAEIKSAESSYEEQREALGRRFHDAVLASLAQIEEFPGAAALLAPCAGHVIRAARVWRFPYRIVYAELPEEFRILALAHTSRRPGYWRDRVPP